MKNAKLLFFGALFLTLSACGTKVTETTDLESDVLADSLESAVTTTTSVLDEQSTSSFVLRSQKPSVLELVIGHTANAEACQRAMAGTCDQGLKAAQYNNCEVGLSGRTLNGSVSLNFSDLACGLSQEGDYVVRKVDLAWGGTRGGSLVTKSVGVTDYLGNSYGEGTKLTRTAAGHNLEILGKQKQLTVRERVRMDVSVRTLQPIEVSGGVDRDNRILNNGIVEVNHNQKQFTAQHRYENVAYSSACCHPISGKIYSDYSGSFTGSAVVTFLSCGEVQIEKLGEAPRTARFETCE